MVKLVIIISKQIAHLWIEQKFVKAFKVSTALNGLGFMENSNCTPIGQLRVAEKIGYRAGKKRGVAEGDSVEVCL